MYPYLEFIFCVDFKISLPGHVSVLQVSVSVAEPLHATPPYAAGVASGLVRVLVPSSHVAEQADHSPYSPHTQLMGSAYEKKTVRIIPIKY